MNRAINILAILAVVVFCVQVFSDNKADVDLWGNVGFVKDLPWGQGFKYVNTFSFTEPNLPWINHEWLAQYILHVTYTHLGNPGLLALKIILGLCVIAMIYLIMKESRSSGTVSFLWLLLVISTIGYGFSTRPHLFTYLLYAFFLLTLWRYQTSGTKQILLIPLLGIIWVNLHGGFFIGALLLLLYTILEMMKKCFYRGDNISSGNTAPLAVIIILFIATTFINPYGLRLWGFLFRSLMKSRPYLSEWAAFTQLSQLREHLDFVILSLLSLLVVCFSSRPKDLTWLGILFASFISAIIMRRNIPLFAITAGFVLPGHIEDVAGKSVRKIFSRVLSPVLAVILLFFVVISMGYTLFFHKTNLLEIEVRQDFFPVRAVSFIKANEISGNLLVFFDWAEYCIWKIYPRCRVFLDGRFCSAYSPKTIDDYFNFLYLADSWENALTNYPVDIVLIHKRNPVYAKMLSLPGWILVYNNEIAGLFLKKAEHAKFLTKLGENKVRYPEVRKNECFP